MSRKDKVRALERAAESMVQGSLSESTRQCGDPSCACAHDPAYRHGPHLYFRYKAEGRAHSVYVPPEQDAAIRNAQQAWREFQELGAEISADNRARLLHGLEHEKRAARARRVAGKRARRRSGAAK
jgi:hypothetical protein